MNDIFFEQLVKVRLTASKTALIVLVCVAALALSVLLFIYSAQIPLLVIAIVAVIYGAYYLVQSFFAEYEYIITNGSVDIDKIIGKSRRKRVISFECSDIIKTAKSSDTNIPRAVDKVFICSNKSENAVYVVASKGQARIAVLMEPDEKTVGAITEAAPRIIKKDLFI